MTHFLYPTVGNKYHVQVTLKQHGQAGAINLLPCWGAFLTLKNQLLEEVLRLNIETKLWACLTEIKDFSRELNREE